MRELKRKLLRYILLKLGNCNYAQFKECYDCATKRWSPYLCKQCYWVRENYKP